MRENNLPLVVDNPRFLILPWITIPNLGSHILAIVRRRLPQDWTERYHTTPVLIETFVETPRYTGAVYRASGWIHVRATQGRGCYRGPSVRAPERAMSVSPRTKRRRRPDRSAVPLVLYGGRSRAGRGVVVLGGGGTTRVRPLLALLRSCAR